MWQKIFIWSKKIHKLVMWGVVVLGSWMMLSGFLMNRELEGNFIPRGVDMVFVRVWHNAISQWFLVILLLQIATGLAMWLGPRMIARQRRMTNTGI